MTLMMMVIAAMPLAAGHAAEKLPVPDKVPCAIADKQDFQTPDHLHLTGWLGSRIAINERIRPIYRFPAFNNQ